MDKLRNMVSPFTSSTTKETLKPLAPVEPVTLELLQRLAEFTPLRLTENERKLLDVIEGALDHSEYTSNVDVSTNDHYVREDYNKERKIERELHEFCQVMLGLSAGNDYQTRGRQTLGESLKSREAFFAQCMEIGRRFKILNPDKCRNTYGKLLYIMMDSVNPSVRNSFQLLKPIETVALLCQDAQILQDEALLVACQEITSASGDATRRKMEARQYLVDRYPAVANRVMDSLEDALSFWRSNRDPVDSLLRLLHEFFDANKEGTDRAYSLSLQGRHGAGHKLSHDHRTQFTFCFQSLLLWKQVMNDFFRLWIGAEKDLLSPRNGYSLVNTGQGLQRCQAAPETRRNMNQVLAQVQSNTGSNWVGLSVVHLGDREVPNALIFIDKYTQIPRIIAPIVQCVRALLPPHGELYVNPNTRRYLEANYGSAENCARFILADLFRGGFDGSGDLGGSCIDGRLTSLWNWSSLIEKKRYYPVFLMSGFIGFDGKF